MKKYLLILLSIVSLHAFGQQSLQWPPVTSLNKPWSRWWWQGSAVNKPDLTNLMQQYQKAGLGGLEVTPIYGVKGEESRFIKYLSPQWMEMLEFTLREAKRLNLGIDLATGTGWPFGGPWVSPADASKDINLKTYTVKGGDRLADKITYRQKPLVRTVSGAAVNIRDLSYPIASNRNLQGYAFDQVKYEMKLPLMLLIAFSDSGEKLDLTAKTNSDGALDWVAPPGTWKLYALFMGWHGKMVERAAPGGEGEAIDHFSVKALDNYLGHFDTAFKKFDVAGIRSFFNDSYEVDDARGQANWTPELFGEFKNRRGYDLKDHLDVLFKVDTAEINSRVLFDYRLTISELVLEKFTKPWHTWARSKGAMIRNQSHGSPANILDLYSAIDIPETEGADILRFKFATSAAHVMGKPLASSESATWLNEHFQSSLAAVKQSLDKYFVGGVNHIFYHGTNFSPPKAEWPGWLFYAAVHFTPANSFWKDFSTVNRYVAHVQSFLQQGKPDNDILLYFPVNDRFMEPLAPIRSRRNINAYTDGQPALDLDSQRKTAASNTVSAMTDSIDALSMNLLQHFDGMEGFENTLFKSGAEYLLKEGFAFDLISDKQLQQVRTINQGLSTGGVSYQTIILSDCKFITVETMEKLLQLARTGATVVFYKNLPQKVPGFARWEQHQQSLQQLTGKLQFVATGNPAVTKSVIGKGVFLKGEDLAELLAVAKIRQERMVKQDLMFVRRSYKNGHVYFITNNSGHKVAAWVPIAIKAVGVALYDPMLERTGAARTRKDANGDLEVFLSLNKGESCIVQTMPSSLQAGLFPYMETNGEPREIAGNWEIRFVEGGPELPAITLNTKLFSWTDLPGENVKAFSGTAQYSIALKRPVGNFRGWLLDLGDVRETAEVLLNGKKLATLVGPVFQVLIPASLLKMDNLLQVNVSNGMANRIADMDRRGVEWKKFYNVNFPSRLAENRDAKGIFTAAKWKPEPSGLLGPVTLTPAK